ncbi:MAG: UDP-3-O-(3-hydroxymyristoyl)glucosamine N-acyltransferase [Puniceicoccales bacterium]|jgi:UDP-3-O-[3-hydroxymyristoyl] glucosamine N-acyltransferase|nr:UDP-3-O-(3-hydroxymyristoyl)glucosamine N-acyltransferase [Puniceicoccales bacterium]
MGDFSFSIPELEILLKPSRVVGQSRCTISQISDLTEAEAGHLSFLSNPKYRSEVGRCRASLLLLPENYAGQPKEEQVFFHCPSPSRSLGILCRHIEGTRVQPPVPGIHPTAIVEEGAAVDPSAHIGPYAVIGKNALIEAEVEIQSHVVVGPHCRIGAQSKIYPHVSLLEGSQIGRRVIIHPGTVIGSEGFGYETNAEGVHEKLSHIGHVVVEDDVEIGANTAVDRARFASTLLEHGSKIDNLVQIGHNVRIGAHCILVAQVGIAGSSSLEEHVTLGGQVGIAGHIRIGHHSQIGAQSGVAKSIPPKSFLRGTPAMEYAQANRFYAVREKLPQLVKSLRQREGMKLKCEEPKSGADGLAPNLA